MAYVAMNRGIAKTSIEFNFLNGVCRHELPVALAKQRGEFLNGVCRHEPSF